MTARPRQRRRRFMGVIPAQRLSAFYAGKEERVDPSVSDSGSHPPGDSLPCLAGTPPLLSEAVMRAHLLLCLSLLTSETPAAPPLPVPPPLHPKEVSGARDDPGPGVQIDYRKGTVSRRDAGGRLLWTVKPEGSLAQH